MSDRAYAPFDPSDEQITEAAFHAAMCEALARHADRRPPGDAPSAALSRVAGAGGLRLVGGAGPRPGDELLGDLADERNGCDGG